MSESQNEPADKAGAARREAEAARNLLNNVIERINDGFVALDSDWRYTYVNARAARMLQRESPRELIGKHIWSEYPEGIGQPFYKAYVKALETQQPVIFEDYYPPWDQWFENRVYPSPDGLTIYFTDITVRKRAEEALRQSAVVFDNTQDGMMITDLDARILRVNASFTEITGYTEAEVLGQPPFQLRAGELDRHVHKSLWSELRASGQWKGEIWNRRKNGEVYPEWLTLCTVRDEQGEPVGYVGVFSDISERKQAERSLNRVNRALMALSACNEALIRANDEAELLDKVCSVIAEVGQYPLVWIGRAEQDAHKTVRPVAQRGFNADYVDSLAVGWGGNERGGGPTGVAIRSGQAVVVKDMLGNPDFEWWQTAAQTHGLAESIALPIRVSDTIYGALNIYAQASDAFDEEEMRLLQELADDLGFGIATLRAQSERQQLQQQLVQAQKMEAIGQLTGGVAHDFNNILASIMGYTELALQRLEEGADAKLSDYLKEVFRAGERARDLIAQMLTFSRATAGNPKPIALEPMVKEVVKLLRFTLPSSIRLDVTAHPEVPNIMMDPVQLHQVIMNLCINARDALEGEGLIEVSIRPVNVIDATCDACHEPVAGEFVELAVRDTGAGIEAAKVARIFEPFYTTKETGKGTGMGLAVVHGIVHEHGGHIRVHSAPGRGTTFGLLFPAVHEAACDTGNEDFSLSGVLLGTNGGRVMVVDDDESMAMFVSELLNLAGYQVSMLTNSIEALALFKQDPQGFDMVITDQTMPGMTGVELARQMLGLRGDIPIVLCTGYSEDLDEDGVKAIGIRQLLDKPYKPKLLLEAVKNVMGC